MTKAPDGNRKNNSEPPSRAYASFGWNLATGFGLLVGGGLYLDRTFGGDKSFWTIAGIFLAVVFAVYETWKLLKDFNNP